MDIREFKKWIIENHFEENDLFQEALICYNNRAYKAAYMFSYLAFTNYMRYLIIDYEGSSRNNGMRNLVRTIKLIAKKIN